jgi:hypothetical protein
VIAEPFVRQELAPGPLYALDACALSFGATRGPILLVSSQPSWEHMLRRRLGDRFFTVDDPERPSAQAWVGAAWLEPQRTMWRDHLVIISRELPSGSLLSVVQSLPLTVFGRATSPGAVGITPNGVARFRHALTRQGFRIERAFGFQTLWWIALRRVAARLARYRPDISDRIQFAMRRGFATRGPILALAMTGLIEARAGMRPE